MEKRCVICKTIFVPRTRLSKARQLKQIYCSLSCRYRGQIGHLVSEETRKKIGDANRGNVMSEETREKLRVIRARQTIPKEIYIANGLKQRGENNPHWKGDEVGYGGLHEWVKKELGQPDVCVNCGKSGLKGRHIQWSNKSGKYRRVIDDWQRLCARCHSDYDWWMRLFKKEVSYV